MFKKSRSPWGRVDHHSPIGDLGFHHHSTPGHGGIYVPPSMLAKMPAPYRNSDGWYEEDCEWAKVALSFPSGISERELDQARKTAINWFPKEFMQVTGISLNPEDSSTLAKELFHSVNQNNFIVICAMGSGPCFSSQGRIDIPEGMVGCHAVKGGHNDTGSYAESDTRWALVSSAEYDTRSIHGFVLQDHHATWPTTAEVCRKSQLIASIKARFAA